MAFSGKLDVEVEVKTGAEEFWQSIRESTTLFPKAVPHQYKSIHVLEGDGKSVGSVRVVHFAEGSPLVKTTEEKIEAVDEEKKTVAYSVVGGDILKYYKNFKATLVVSSKDGGSKVKWDCQFEKASEEVPSPNLIRDFAVQTFQDLDAYLLAAAAN
ncbi:MLP-like protein 423 [Diospyros lotus]|uniref:MLP-like protein 423 n=1 Tax=Diospyros lotus TaxID=55363 RepID=UPI00224DE394|nr:MLP-like protein 423 [Diospyros lotus]